MCSSRTPAWLTQSPQEGRGHSMITRELAVSNLPALLCDSGTLTSWYSDHPLPCPPVDWLLPVLVSALAVGTFPLTLCLIKFQK